MSLSDTPSGTRTAIPAVEGWFTLADPPALLGSRCTSCGHMAFPKATTFCANPVCTGSDFAETPLSRQGRLWSYTDARYRPPPPFVGLTEPHEPYALAAVELEAEQMVVLGQVIAGVGVDQLHVGQPVELVLDVLYSDDEHDYLVWKWAPMAEVAA